MCTEFRHHSLEFLANVYTGIFDEYTVILLDFLRRDFAKGNDFFANQARLAKSVLEELPGQVTLYMELKGIQPGPGRRAPPPQTASSDAPWEGMDAPPPAYNSLGAGAPPGGPPGYGAPTSPYAPQSGAPPAPYAPQSGASFHASAPYPPPASNPFYPSAP